ncbi:unnamed protein product, partial [marine sediment metagenome]
SHSQIELQQRIEQMVREHHAELYRYAMRLCGLTADAEDITQQVFLIAQTKISQLRDESLERNWLFTILRNTYFKLHRKQSPLPVSSLGVDLDHLPEDTDDVDIDTELLQLAINELPDDFKVTLLMFYFEGCSYKEIAAALEIPHGTVMSRLSRAKQHLRTKLFPKMEKE